MIEVQTGVSISGNGGGGGDDGGWGVKKWFNYKPNTISLFVTRDFMVWAAVWQKQLSASNAEALHCPRSAGPF